MIKKKKTCFIVGSFCIVIGIVLVSTSFAFGGVPSSDDLFLFRLKQEIDSRLYGDAKDVTVTESASTSTVVETIENVEVTDRERGKCNNIYDESSMSWTGSQYSLPDLTLESLNITLDHSSVEITQGDEFKVETDVDSNIHCFLEEGELSVEEEGSWFEFSTRNGLKNNSSKVKITLLPSQLEELQVSTGAGNIQISDLQTDSLMVSAGAGAVTVKNLIASESDFELGAGNVSITDFVGTEDTNISSGVGSVNMEGTFLNSTTIQGGVGSVNLRIHGSMDDYGINAESGMGTVKVNGQKVSSFFGANYETESENNEIYIDGGIGNVDIQFIEQ